MPRCSGKEPVHGEREGGPMPAYIRMLVHAVVLGLLLSGAMALAELPTKPVLTLAGADALPKILGT